jgi:hypothetical protein
VHAVYFVSIFVLELQYVLMIAETSSALESSAEHAMCERYQRIPRDINGYQWISRDINRYQGISTDIKGY